MNLYFHYVNYIIQNVIEVVELFKINPYSAKKYYLHLVFILLSFSIILRDKNYGKNKSEC